jgi:hypothetical protein
LGVSTVFFFGVGFCGFFCAFEVCDANAEKRIMRNAVESNRLPREKCKLQVFLGGFGDFYEFFFGFCIDHQVMMMSRESRNTQASGKQKLRREKKFEPLDVMQNMAPCVNRGGREPPAPAPTVGMRSRAPW